MPFPYAGDGFTVELLKVGIDRDFGKATAGLIAAGYIEGDNVTDTATGDKPIVAADTVMIADADAVAPQISQHNNSRKRR